jgi:hypothetical protein
MREQLMSDKDVPLLPHYTGEVLAVFDMHDEFVVRVI